MENQLFKISPIEVGLIHFIGIGGIGMSGIAEILNNLGYKVQGSDTADSYVTDRLKEIGIQVFIGQKEENIQNAALIVKSTAIKDTNPEMLAAKKINIPIIKRSEMLAEIMRFKHCIAVSGTHGKTTTTSLVAKMLETAGLNPTIINGGIINELGTNAKLGNSEFLVAEADESDGTFNKIPAFVSIVTNIDPEHLDYYGTFENAKEAYFKFIENLPFYGFAVLCYDHPNVIEVAQRVSNRQIISYGISYPNLDLKATNIRESTSNCVFDLIISESLQKQLNLNFTTIQNIKLGMLGEHNIQNSLSSIAVALKLGINPQCIQEALANFKGVKRRFTKVGEVDQISIIDDYAHHPIEISATLKTAKKIANLNGSRVIAIAQPHRYSRVKDLIYDFSMCFKDADILFVSDIYSAGEEPIADINTEKLIQLIRQNSGQDANLLHDHKKIAEILNVIAKPKDIIIFLGAGNVTKWAYSLPSELSILRNAKVA